MKEYQKIRRVLQRAVLKVKPPVLYQPSEWVEKNLTFPDGPLANQPVVLYPFQKLPLDIITDHSVKKVVLMSSAQLLKTTILQNAALYFIANDPSNMAFAGATQKETSQFKSGKFDPVLQRSELRHLVSSKSDKNSVNNTNQVQLRDGTFCYFMNLSAPSSLRGKTVQRIFLDEVSGTGTTSEGNPLRLAEQRTAAFVDGLVMVASTPTHSTDLICTEYQLSDQRKYFVSCPECQHSHELVWENVKFNFKQIQGGTRRLPDSSTARLCCPQCNHTITEAERARIVRDGEWRSTNPDADPSVVGFHISRLYAPSTSIRKLVEEYGQAYFDFNLQSFFNTSLGLPYDQTELKELDLIQLETLRDSTFDLKNIPASVLGVVYAVDQQKDRLELLALGVAERELHVLGHRVFRDPDCTKLEARAYAELRGFIDSPLKNINGNKVKVLGCFVDSSNGLATATVYRFCASHPLLTPIKGSKSTSAPLFAKSKTGGHELIMFNVNDGKTQINTLMRQAISTEFDEVPVQLKFSHDLPEDAFLQLTSETLQRKGSSNLHWVLKKGSSRNEMLDLLCYCYCGFQYILSKLGNQPYRTLREYHAKQKVKPPINKTVEQSQHTQSSHLNVTRKSPRSNGWFD